MATTAWRSPRIRRGAFNSNACRRAGSGAPGKDCQSTAVTKFVIGMRKLNEALHCIRGVFRDKECQSEKLGAPYRCFESASEDASPISIEYAPGIGSDKFASREPTVIAGRGSTTTGRRSSNNSIACRAATKIDRNRILVSSARPNLADPLGGVGSFTTSRSPIIRAPSSFPTAHRLLGLFGVEARPYGSASFKSTASITRLRSRSVFWLAVDIARRRNDRC